MTGVQTCALPIYDIPLSGDGTPGKYSPPPNALTELDRLIPEMAATKDDALAAYDLLWVEHLVGDVHQPLHAVSRYLDSQPTGDAGGNYVYFEGNRTLHGIWDDAGGLLPYTAQDSPDDADTIRLAHELTAEYPEPPGLSLTPKDWINESFALDKSDVYTFGPVAGTKEAPLKVQPGYLENVKKVSRRRMAMAGYRLAAVLNRELH